MVFKASLYGAISVPEIALLRQAISKPFVSHNMYL